MQCKHFSAVKGNINVESALEYLINMTLFLAQCQLCPLVLCFSFNYSAKKYICDSYDPPKKKNLKSQSSELTLAFAQFLELHKDFKDFYAQGLKKELLVSELRASCLLGRNTTT
jgi:hypothetical protein